MCLQFTLFLFLKTLIGLKKKKKKKESALGKTQTGEFRERTFL